MSDPFPHPDARELADYLAGRLPAANVLAVSDHLAVCPDCRETLQASTSSASPATAELDLPPPPADTPPGYEEMAGLLDGTLDADESAAVRDRLTASPVAAAEFADLRAFRDESLRLPPKLHGPAPIPVVGQAAPPAMGKIVALPSGRWASLAALAAAAAVLLSAGWWVVETRLPSRGPAPLWADADLSGLPTELRQSVEQAARTGTLESAPLPLNLRPPAETLAGAEPDPAGFHQVTPVGVVVRETRPVFRWTARAGATAYIVYLTDGNAPMVRQEVPADRTEWTPPTPLTHGAVYEWQVEARRADEVIDRAPRPPAPEVRFMVLDKARAAEVGQVEKEYQHYPLILGTAYARAGLGEDATRQFEILARLYPNSPVAGRLLLAARQQVARTP